MLINDRMQTGAESGSMKTELCWRSLHFLMFPNTYGYSTAPAAFNFLWREGRRHLQAEEAAGLHDENRHFPRWAVAFDAAANNLKSAIDCYIYILFLC